MMQDFNSNIVQASSLNAWFNSRFRDGLPHRPYVANVKNMCHFGKKDIEESYKYIQANNPIKTSWIVLDIDCGIDSTFLYEQPEFYRHIDAPAPNIVLKSNENGHYQIFYAIDPVYTGMNARNKPQRFLDAVKRALIATIPSADPNFIGSKVISWNPLSDNWSRFEIHNAVYSLNELKDMLNQELFMSSSFDLKCTEKIAYAEEGERNMSLFKNLRLWSYKRVLSAKESITYPDWLKLLQTEAMAINESICSVPMPLKEVEGIAKSVARFTWFRYTGNQRQKTMEFSDGESIEQKQVASAKRTHSIVKNNTIQLISAAVATLVKIGKKVTYSEISRISGKHRSTVYRYKEQITQEVDRLLTTLSGKEKHHNKDVPYAVYQVTGSYRSLIWSLFSAPIKSFLNKKSISHRLGLGFNKSKNGMYCDLNMNQSPYMKHEKKMMFNSYAEMFNSSPPLLIN
ncbi:replication initiation protein [Psychromonas sp. SP041]|uniref:replication initiation protein n=1 Tax=Psychromonas sp. SP041 TaxID=1365007 RepID=UPI0010C7C1A6|nr:replication initiation protein [Psychromonas sp. SP041]